MCDWGSAHHGTSHHTWNRCHLDSAMALAKIRWVWQIPCWLFRLWDIHCWILFGWNLSGILIRHVGNCQSHPSPSGWSIEGSIKYRRQWGDVASLGCCLGHFGKVKLYRAPPKIRVSNMSPKISAQSAPSNDQANTSRCLLSVVPQFASQVALKLQWLSNIVDITIVDGGYELSHNWGTLYRWFSNFKWPVQ